MRQPPFRTDHVNGWGLGTRLTIALELCHGWGHTVHAGLYIYMFVSLTQSLNFHWLPIFPSPLTDDGIQMYMYLGCIYSLTYSLTFNSFTHNLSYALPPPILPPLNRRRRLCQVPRALSGARYHHRQCRGHHFRANGRHQYHHQVFSRPGAVPGHQRAYLLHQWSGGQCLRRCPRGVHSYERPQPHQARLPTCPRLQIILCDLDFHLNRADVLYVHVPEYIVCVYLCTCACRVRVL